jgi:hypothetical protein
VKEILSSANEIGTHSKMEKRKMDSMQPLSQRISRKCIIMIYETILTGDTPKSADM